MWDRNERIWEVCADDVNSFWTAVCLLSSWVHLISWHSFDNINGHSCIRWMKGYGLYETVITRVRPPLRKFASNLFRFTTSNACIQFNDNFLFFACFNAKACVYITVVIWLKRINWIAHACRTAEKVQRSAYTMDMWYRDAYANYVWWDEALEYTTRHNLQYMRALYGFGHAVMLMAHDNCCNPLHRIRNNFCELLVSENWHAKYAIFSLNIHQTSRSTHAHNSYAIIWMNANRTTIDTITKLYARYLKHFNEINIPIQFKIPINLKNLTRIFQFFFVFVLKFPFLHASTREFMHVLTTTHKN